MFQVFQMLYRYIASVSYGCCESRSGCCICCNGCTHMLQAFVPNVLSIFLDIRCNCVYLDIAYVSHICCKCFIWTLRMFYNSFIVFSGAFVSISDTKCFIYLTGAVPEYFQK
jgi:hypothetical protein